MEIRGLRFGVKNSNGLRHFRPIRATPNSCSWWHSEPLSSSHCPRDYCAIAPDDVESSQSIPIVGSGIATDGPVVVDCSIVHESRPAIGWIDRHILEFSILLNYSDRWMSKPNWTWELHPFYPLWLRNQGGVRWIRRKAILLSLTLLLDDQPFH